MFGGVYKKRKVLLTGHTGFKGSWLALWLKNIGADVTGYSLDPPSTPNHYDLLNLDIASFIGDIRDPKNLQEIFFSVQPEIVFHLAAQPLVRSSYNNPVETFETNVMGTINVLEAARQTGSVRAIVNITSDKCYENREWIWGYRENDPMGGYDPYSASKGCAELAANSYRNSFFNPDDYEIKHHILLASARAGNVIGGGDWAEDRLIPDIMRAAGKKEKVIIRNPHATRPWQHVLEPLSGYLMLGQKLLEGKKEIAGGWNLGPNDVSNMCVEDVVSHVRSGWEKVDYEIRGGPDFPHEASFLKLDCSKAHTKLKWRPVWDIDKTLEMTVRWYKEFYENGRILSFQDLEGYIMDAVAKRLVWASEAE
jgi:CDP-glucose 4,6-dehydratase